MAYEWHDFFGNAGLVLIVGTYLLLQLGKMTSDHLSYSVLNGLGALFIMISLYVDFNLSAFILEAFWILFSLIGIWRVVAARSVQQPETG
ncbi:MAG: hypothetical protein RQ826_00795 [Xanthomonadales bacterium]|nr:hypothetical protein [Xanthomonadales bacterium]